MDNFIQYPVFQTCDKLLAFTTTKQSMGTPAARFTGDEASVFVENRKELARLLGIKTEQLVFPRQTHTSTVCAVNEIPEMEIAETDALITNQPGICICVQTADCVPILLFDPVEKVAAAVHAGWRGTVQKIVVETVLKMQKEYKSDPANLKAAIGPSIGPVVYEVGSEVEQAVRRTIPEAEQTLCLNGSGKYHFNLWDANRNLLLSCGIQAKNIDVLEECSFQEAEKYYSARREGIQTGRMVSGIMIY
ncbi:peptidoglycan editing factor PgeF [Maribellus sp. YY47]|uniref:peptidoglycan editing factor PgeF n=1 Tax=Maribellus sp. YY47 TaxID=2929486 RepID=UPI002001D8DF|nr:peptidoglycan editing factor PgeF [Maribellus sp. YY47]MCK3686212.1 peptidoglycan editing factor PgeF [Maribellus sp. YY47]